MSDADTDADTDADADTGGEGRCPLCGSPIPHSDTFDDVLDDVELAVDDLVDGASRADRVAARREDIYLPPPWVIEDIDGIWDLQRLSGSVGVNPSQSEDRLREQLLKLTSEDHAVVIECQRCDHNWVYTGSAEWRTTCPHCGTTVLIESRTLFPDKIPPRGSASEGEGAARGAEGR